MKFVYFVPFNSVAICASLCQELKDQQFPLSTAKIASFFYPALGGADARNAGGDAPLSPPYDPPSGKESRQESFLQAGTPRPRDISRDGCWQLRPLYSHRA